MAKYVYPFTEGNADMKDLLGGKGANLAEMSNLGLPVPAGVTITTEAWAAWNAMDSAVDQLEFIRGLVDGALELFVTEYGFTEGHYPLLAVRSGARVSMPGMMDTILNVGVQGQFARWEKILGEKVALDCQRRYQHMFGEVALGVPGEKFEKALTKIKSLKYGMKAPPKNDSDMSLAHYRKLVEKYDALITDEAEYWKYDLEVALELCVTSVFRSWNSDRAKAYRKMHNIPDDWGTAVTIQQMVFGNASDQSCSGVLFTRDPSAGTNMVMGEFLPNAQGEDVVAGIRTPQRLIDMKDWNSEVYTQLVDTACSLESHYRDMQDIEFTVENEKLYILQTRTGKRSAKAAFVIAHEMANSGMITKKDAVRRVTGKQYAQLNTPTVAMGFKKKPDVIGLGASAGVVTGMAVFSKEEAEKCPVDCILITKETTPNDFSGMAASVGILTSTGGTTSHAAVVARGMDKPCVVGATELEFQGDMVGVGGVFGLASGDVITIDGTTGNVWFHTKVPVQASDAGEEVATLLKWAGLEDQEVVTITSLGAVKNCAQGVNVMIDARAIGADFALVMAAAGERGLTGVIDLVGDSHVDDKQIAEIFGLGEVDASTMKVMSKISSEGWVVNAADSGQRKILKSGGWTLVNLINDLGEFLKAKGVSEFSNSFLGMLMEQGVSSVDDMLKVNQNVSRLRRALPVERLVYEVLGK